MLPFSAVSILINIAFDDSISTELKLVNEYANVYTLLFAFWFPSRYRSCIF
ncbi:hypothetical protein AOT82_1316 [Psychrobacter sp. AntiMn-1]|nr:hypothetical protein AOT82_1316 [Psychrobacter sp. AntiMn-1]